jgi:hypothetical protein
MSRRDQRHRQAGQLGAGGPLPVAVDGEAAAAYVGAAAEQCGGAWRLLNRSLPGNV